MDDWKKFNETLSPLTEHFYIHLDMQDITDPDYANTKRVCKDIEIKNPGEYHDLHVQSNVFSKQCLLCIFSSWISMTSGFKKRLK